MLTAVIANREKEMPWEWMRFVHEDWNDGCTDLPAISRAWSVVAAAVKALPAGKEVEPWWPIWIAELVAIFFDEKRIYEAELAKEAADKLAALRNK